MWFYIMTTHASSIWSYFAVSPVDNRKAREVTKEQQHGAVPCSIRCLTLSNFPPHYAESGHARSASKLNFCDKTSKNSCRVFGSSSNELQCTDSLTANLSEVVNSRKKARTRFPSCQIGWMTQYS